MSGSDARGLDTAASIAWALETSAVSQGWPAGASLGTESDLIERFGVSRAVVRQAVRILESRGSMRMRRGCRGGLRLVHADLDTASSALATYLRACGCNEAELRETASCAGPLFDELGRDHLVCQLFQRALAWLGTAPALESASSGRATTIALALLEDCVPIPEQGVYLGAQAELCETLASSRATFRQALRILEDLGMLRVQRGRGGGYWLKRPSTIGVIRQVFALLASRRHQLADIVPATFALNLANLRLAARRARCMDVDLACVLDHPSEPQRWVLLQQRLAQLAGSTLIETLQRSVVAYQARLGSPRVPYAEIADELLELETQLVRELEQGNAVAAERLQRAVHSRLSGLLGCSELSAWRGGGTLAASAPSSA